MAEVKFKKVVVIKISAFETEIIDEKNFRIDEEVKDKEFAIKYYGYPNIHILSFELSMLIE